MSRSVDHLIWGTSDLELGVELMAEMTGVRPASGGSHPGLGTRNALLSLGGRQYLEVIAPDPEQEVRDGLVDRLRRLDRPRLVSWVARAEDLDATAERARACAHPFDAVVEMSRQRPDGVRLTWRFAFVKDHHYDLLIPGFIQWGGTAHPSADSPPGCTLSGLELEHPAPESLRAPLLGLGLDVPVRAGPRPRLKARIDTPRGSLELSS
jgi:hypothetical protein